MSDNIGTKQNVLDLVRKRESLDLQIENMGMMNRPLDTEKRLDFARDYAILTDQRRYADDAYHAAFKAWAMRGFPE